VFFFFYLAVLNAMRNHFVWGTLIEIRFVVVLTGPFFSFLLVSWGGVRLSPLGTSATNWPIVPAPDDR
jgi:hypothetical protein